MLKIFGFYWSQALTTLEKISSYSLFLKKLSMLETSTLIFITWVFTNCLGSKSEIQETKIWNRVNTRMYVNGSKIDSQKCWLKMARMKRTLSLCCSIYFMNIESHQGA